MLAVTTKEKYRAVLNDHKEMENPPTFLFPCLNGRQQRDILLFKEGMGTGDLADFDALFAKVESHLLGWENIEADYSKGQLMDTITYMQCLELLALLTYQSPNIAAKKKSKLPSPSGTGKSAPSAKG